MQLLTTLGLLATTALAAISSPQTSITVTLPSKPPGENTSGKLFVFPPSTHGTLSTFGQTKSAPLSVSNTLVFRNVTQGSYLLDIHCPTHAFAPLRVDVAPVLDGVLEEGGGHGEVKLQVKAWETYRGNDWDNKGEEAPRQVLKGAGGQGVGIGAKVLGEKGYFMERSKFNALSILRNPMILLGLVSMVIIFGMPKLVENMDPEMRAEWEENQKKNPMNALMGGGGAPAASNFDMAAFLAGTSNTKREEPAGDAAASTGSGAHQGGKKRRG
ncbi:hypothetical protein B0T20DRAFT_415477 [Sordaria brevicollis]|uniref:ER membrane protein complex subunit 7 beta-sandwich domain-containing protein n=1 Tax=Sordaria brevicollis TaxID=83679 RepID=A0AAE0PCA5_SORBR|nr:hypothetical protein B0T20DRAFT_415477 [Sordaria brevicollis]